MNWIAIAVGLGAFGIAAYTVSDPMSRARSWPTGSEWERNPEQARRKQYRFTYLFAGLISLVGLVFLLIGITA